MYRIIGDEFNTTERCVKLCFKCFKIEIVNTGTNILRCSLMNALSSTPAPHVPSTDQLLRHLLARSYMLLLAAPHSSRNIYNLAIKITNRTGKNMAQNGGGDHQSPKVRTVHLTTSRRRTSKSKTVKTHVTSSHRCSASLQADNIEAQELDKIALVALRTNLQVHVTLLPR